jgi:peroxiredoxin
LQHGYEVVAVVAQRAAPVRRYIEDEGLPFHILVDADRSVTKTYGVWHRMGVDAWNIARPAVFLIRADGLIQAIWVGERQDEFPGPDEILRAMGTGTP